MSEPTVASGSCECGCGERTRLAPRTDSARGWVKGEPLRFVNGHNSRLISGVDHPSWEGGRIETDGYIAVRDPEHPRAGNGYVREHIVVVEEAMGRSLPEGAEVHHVNGDRADNRPENLVVCEDRAYHCLLHRRQRALDACGKPGWLRCPYCKTYDDPENLWVHPKTGAARHRACHAARQRARGR